MITDKRNITKMEAIKNFFMEILMLKEETKTHIGLSSFKSKKAKNKKDIKLSDLMKGNL